MKTHSQIYNEYSKIDSALTLNFESIWRSNSQWNITLLDYKQKIYRSGKCYARILYQIEFYNFCLVLNEIWNKLLLTIPVIDKRANMIWYCIRTRALGDSFFYNSPAPAFLFLLLLNVELSLLERIWQHIPLTIVNETNIKYTCLRRWILFAISP
jgi:hypothetical protein